MYSTLAVIINVLLVMDNNNNRTQVKEALKQAEYNPSLFGDGRKGRFCICEVPGQVPCPRYVPIKNVEHSWHNKDGNS